LCIHIYICVIFILFESQFAYNELPCGAYKRISDKTDPFRSERKLQLAVSECPTSPFLLEDGTESSLFFSFFSREKEKNPEIMPVPSCPGLLRFFFFSANPGGFRKDPFLYYTLYKYGAAHETPTA
jgi:hypothetical protein